jgi:type IV pilus assembly protein PilE
MATKNKGFTLIELMIVVAIIGILVTVVMPSYRVYILESQRFDAQGEMLQMINLQERFFIDNFRYTDDITELGYPADPFVINYSGNSAFEITASACPNAAPYLDNPGLNRCFILSATARGDQAEDGDLLIDSRGRKEHNYAGIVLRDWSGNDL